MMSILFDSNEKQRTFQFHFYQSNVQHNISFRALLLYMVWISNPWMSKFIILRSQKRFDMKSLTTDKKIVVIFLFYFLTPFLKNNNDSILGVNSSLK